MFFIIEIQGYGDSFAQLVTQKSSRNEAEADYYRVLSAAAISNVPIHTAVMIDHTGHLYYAKQYEHGTDES